MQPPLTLAAGPRWQIADVSIRNTFSTTCEDHLLRGQDSYNLNENPEYADAMGRLGGKSQSAATAFLDSVRSPASYCPRRSVS